MLRYTMNCNEIQKLGRGYVYQDAFPMFTTGSGIEFDTNASELWFELEADFDAFEPWVSVLLNGVRIQRVMMQRGCNRICAFRGLNPETRKTVRLTKDVQAMPDDMKHSLIIKAVEADRNLFAPAKKSRKLEFIGDSITSGEGLIGAKQEEDWVPFCFDSVNNYTNLIATRLDAEYRVISQSGWGVNSSWDNIPFNTLPAIYEKVAGTAHSEVLQPFGAGDMHNFASWQPDVVIINLGTNDNGAYNNPAYIDPQTKQEYKMHLLPDGSRDPQDIARFQSAVVRFLYMVRKNNPNAQILWVYGILGNDMEPDIRGAMKQFQEETGDKNIAYLKLPPMTDDQVGARQHPGIKAHETMAEVIVEALK